MHGPEMHSPKPGQRVQVTGFAPHAGGAAKGNALVPAGPERPAHPLLSQVSKKEKKPPRQQALFQLTPAEGRRMSRAHLESLSPSLAPLLPEADFPQENNQPLSHRHKAAALRSSKSARAIPRSCSTLLLLPSRSSLPPAPARATPEK